MCELTETDRVRHRTANIVSMADQSGSIAETAERMVTLAQLDKRLVKTFGEPVPENHEETYDWKKV